MPNRTAYHAAQRTADRNTVVTAFIAAQYATILATHFVAFVSTFSATDESTIQPTDWCAYFAAIVAAHYAAVIATDCRSNPAAVLTAK